MENEHNIFNMFIKMYKLDDVDQYVGRLSA